MGVNNTKHVKITGLPELLKKLGDLGQFSTIERIAYRATFGASKDVRESARLHAASMYGTGKHVRRERDMPTGALMAGFAIKRYKTGTKYGYNVGVRSGNKRAGDLAKKEGSAGDPYYWWFLEFGTKYIAPGWGFFAKAFAEARTQAPAMIIKQGTAAVLSSGNAALKKYGSGK